MMPRMCDSLAKVAVVADDHEFVRDALAAMLARRFGFGLTLAAPSFDEALDLLVRTPGVSLALFDLQMPGMENAASIGAVRECFPATKVVIVSGSSRRQDVLEALDAGVHGYIPKELSAKQIGDALETVLNGGVYVPATLPDRDNAQAVPATPARPPRLTCEPLPRLTPRQRDVLELVVRGMTNKEIARALQLGEGTVKVHVAAILQCLGVPNRSAAAVLGLRLLETGGREGEADPLAVAAGSA